MAKTLTEVIAECGIQLEDSSGDRKVAKCMFHEGDHEASFTVYPNGTYFCFGCPDGETWGDAVTFLVQYKKMSFDDAVKHVGADYKVRTADKPQVIKVKNTLTSYRYLYSIADQYHNFLLQTPGAQNYLQKRGLTMETITKYKLGYTDGRVLSLSWAWEQEIALEMGLINKNGYELLSHRITIPNVTDAGHVDFIIGRTVTNDKIKYLGARMPKPVMGFYEVRHSPVIFLVEGQFDWLTLRQWGYPAAVIGGSHLKKHDLSLFSGKRVVLVPDYDEENQGLNTATKIKNQLGANAMILDYSELKTGPGKLDISTLAESPGGESLFNTIVRENLPWLTLLSSRIQKKWFPNLVSTIPSLLT